MDKDLLVEKVRIKLAEEFEVDIEAIQSDASLIETLNLDSLDFVDMVVLLEQNFGITTTAKDFVGIVTFQDFYNFITDRLVQ